MRDVVAQFGAEVLRNEKGNLGGHAKRTVVYRFRLPGGECDAIMTQVLVMAGGRTYMAQTLVPAPIRDETQATVDRFHDSAVLKME
jgi:hypothetical protein